MPTTINVITMPVDDLLDLLNKQVQASKTEILKEWIASTAGVNWNLYGTTMSRTEVASVFNRTPDTIDNWIEKGTLKAIVVDGRVAGISKENVMKLFYNKN